MSTAHLPLMLMMLLPATLLQQPPEPRSVTVLVVAHDDKKPVPAARVSVLSENKCEVSAAHTNADGVAKLALHPRTNPKYLLVEADGFFMAGTRLRGGGQYTLDLLIYYLASAPEASGK